MTTFEQRLQEILSGTYDIERELGGGGMSRVFVAIDKSLGRKVVIKLLSPELTAEVNRGRFRREIKVAAQLQHPHIVPLLSAGEHEDLVWYTMPFITGESLRSAVERNGPMPVADVVRVLYHVGEALDYAHGEGVVHRDIKPANILRSGSYALVTDFGVAKALNAAMPASGMTATGTAIGTPAYMAPEQLAGEATADHRIDIYALGLLAYELLKGKSPFAAITAQKVLVAVLTQDPEPLIQVRPDVPGRLSEIVMSCLAKEPAHRPATARALLNELDTFSTASGEIRTSEHRVHRVEPTVAPAVSATSGPDTTPSSTAPISASGASGSVAASSAAGPISASAVPALQPTLFIKTPTEPNAIDAEAPGYAPPKKDRTKLVLGGVAILVLAAMGVFFMSQRTANQPSNVAVVPPAKPAPAPLIAGSAASVQPPPAAIAESTAQGAKPVVGAVDSQAIKDSLKRVRAEAAKKAAAKKDSLKKISDSVQRARETNNTEKARRAIAIMLSNAYARKTVTDAATHKSGLLGKRTGDLQTQIDALTPWLKQQGLTYEQFKSAVAESGVKIFDEFGRIMPDALQQFAGTAR